MATLKKYDLTGTLKGEVAIADELLSTVGNLQMIKDYLIAYRTNQRQWSANTQTRSEVNHSKRKPYAQKGTGNARQGFLGAPQFRGGGRVHAPRPKFDQHVRINRKEKRLAIRHLLGEKVQEDRVCVLQYAPLGEPKTQTFSRFLKTLELLGKRVLFLADWKEKEEYYTLCRSIRNLPKVNFSFVADVNGHDVALCHEIILLETAVSDFTTILQGDES